MNNFEMIVKLANDTEFDIARETNDEFIFEMAGDDTGAPINVIVIKSKDQKGRSVEIRIPSNSTNVICKVID